MTESFVVDVSHHQRGVDWARVKNAGIQGVLVKATQGLTYEDDYYDRHTASVKAYGMLHGAYHFGTFGNGKYQAAHFLEVVQPTSQTLLALDFEDDPAGPDMTGAQAAEFVTYIKEQTGRWPMFYSANYWTQPHLNQTSWEIMKNCPLWLAGYVKESKLVIPKPWTNWAIWQYTEGQHGIEPRHTDGMPNGQCDRGRFRGTPDELRAFWTGQAQSTAPQTQGMAVFVPVPGKLDERVRALQNALLAQGGKLPEFGADGYWGGETSVALSKFERDHDLPRTGRISEANLKALGLL